MNLNQLPEKLEIDVMNNVAQLLLSEKKIARKKFIVYQIMGPSLTLFFCPQFGVGPFKAYYDPSSYFMSFGSWACALFCGSIFMGLGSLLSVLFIEEKEYLLIKKESRWGIPLIVVMLFLLLTLTQKLLVAHAHHLDFSFVVWWFFSALISTYLMFNLRLRNLALG